MNIKIITGCLMVTLLLGACKKWINVKPGDRLTEAQLFSTRQGYLNALNGVYVELTNPNLYGEHMTMTNLDLMGQYYVMTNSTHRYYPFSLFNYTSDSGIVSTDNMWKKAYELIVNCNVIIKQCGEESNELLPAPYFGIVKGEALALRAMLHFDMLRLFGPIYSQDKSKPCIPYNIAEKPQVTDLLGPEEIMQNVINDLTAAMALLKDNDPIITNGVLHGSNGNGNNDLVYRQYRLNYYATKALLARAYLWKQDKAMALQEAQQLLTAVLPPAKQIFFTGPMSTTANPDEFDHMFGREVLFAMYTISRQTIFTRFFSPDAASNFRLPFNNNDDNQTRKNELYDDQNDYRLKAWMTQSNTNGSFLTHVKFAVNTKVPYSNMLPLIRLSEVMLIAAECSNTLNEGTAYLNMVRTARNCVSLSPTTAGQLKDYITREFRKEVFGEGQMFFYYKRNAMTDVANSAALTGTKKVTLNVYAVPLPVSEVSVRGN